MFGVEAPLNGRLSCSGAFLLRVCTVLFLNPFLCSAKRDAQAAQYSCCVNFLHAPKLGLLYFRSCNNRVAKQ